MAQLVGVDIGGTNLRVGIVEDRRIVLEQRCQADFAAFCRTHGAQVAWRKIVDITATAIRQALAGYPQAGAIGIGFPGFMDPLSGVIAQSPNLPGLYNVNLAQDLAQTLGRPVIVENDALAAAYGELCLSGNPSGSLIYIGLGTGVGGGLVVAGQPYGGQHGVAMETGHLIVEAGGRLCGCGNRGCLEQYASASGVSASYRISTGREADTAQIAALAQSGDAAAMQAFALAGASLAQALAHIVKVVDVANVVIGGGLSATWPLMQEAFDTRLQADLIPALRSKIVVRISSSGDQAGIIGAALLAGVRSGSRAII